MLNSSQLRPLIDQHASALRLYALQWCRWPDDSVQEAFIEFAQLSELPDNPAAWLFVTVRRRAMNQSRSESRRGRREQQVAEHRRQWFQDASNEAEKSDEASYWQQRLSELPLESREIVIAKIWGQQSFSDIASLVGMSAATVHRRYHAALQQLQQKTQRASDESCKEEWKHGSQDNIADRCT